MPVDTKASLFISLSDSLSAVLGDSGKDIQLSQNCEAVGSPVVQLKDTLQPHNPLLKLLAMHLSGGMGTGRYGMNLVPASHY